MGAGDGTHAQDGVHTNGLRANDGLEAQNGIHTQDELHVNGVRGNGVYANGVHANGVYANGGYANGVYANGGYANGVYVNGGYAHDEEYTNNEEHAHHGEYANGDYTNGVHANGVYANGMHANGGYANGGHANGGYANGVHANDGEYAHGGVYANDDEHWYDREYARNGIHANGEYTNRVYANDGEHAWNGEYTYNREHARDGVYDHDGYVMGAHDGSGVDADDEMDGSASYEASDYENEEGYTQPAPYQYMNRSPEHRHQWDGGLGADRSLSHNYQDTDHFNDGLSVDASQDTGIIPSIERSASASDGEGEYSEPDEGEDSDRNGELHANRESDDNREADDDGGSDSNGELDDDGEPGEDGESNEDSESDEDSEINVFSQLSSRFERVANRNVRNQAMSSSDDSGSDYEDITTNNAPRRRLAPRSYVSEEAARERLRNAAAAYEYEDSDATDSEESPGSGNAAALEDDSGSSSGSELSSLGPTPEPPNPELMRLEQARKSRERPLCTCEGWCSCIKYKAFYGHQQTFEGSNATGSCTENGGTKDVGHGDVEAEENETEEDDGEENGVGGNLVEKDGSGMDAAENNSGEDEALSSDEAAYEPFIIRDPAGLNLPSQTHLSERVLAGEEFPTSAIRATLPPSERDDHTTAELDDFGEQVFSWDQRARPRRPPVGWVGREWIGTSNRREPTLGSEYRHEEAGVRTEDANSLMDFHGNTRARTPEPLGLQSGALAEQISNLERDLEEVDQIG